MKDYYTLDKLEYLYRNLAQNLPHENDGIIFNYDDYLYYPGTSKEVLKWKPPQLNTIDFEVNEFHIKNQSLLVLSVSQTIDHLIKIGCLFFKTETERKKFEEGYESIKNGKKIIECYFDTEFVTDEVMNYYLLDYDRVIRKNDNSLNLLNYDFNYYSWEKVNARQENILPSLSKGAWRFLRFRKDKDMANSIKTYKGVNESIRENMSLVNLIKLLNNKGMDSDIEDDEDDCFNVSYKPKNEIQPEDQKFLGVKRENTNTITENNGNKSQTTKKQKVDTKKSNTDKVNLSQIPNEIKENKPIQSKEEKKKIKAQNQCESLDMLLGGSNTITREKKPIDTVKVLNNKDNEEDKVEQKPNYDDVDSFGDDDGYY